MYRIPTVRTVPIGTYRPATVRTTRGTYRPARYVPWVGTYRPAARYVPSTSAVRTVRRRGMYRGHGTYRGGTVHTCARYVPHLRVRTVGWYVPSVWGTYRGPPFRDAIDRFFTKQQRGGEPANTQGRGKGNRRKGKGRGEDKQASNKIKTTTQEYQRTVLGQSRRRSILGPRIHAAHARAQIVEHS